MNTYRNLLVVEGGDGAGKATQVRMLVEHLRNDGIITTSRDYPGYGRSLFGRFIRESLDGLHGDFLGSDPRLASFPYMLDRMDDVPWIEEWIQKNAVVILDRYTSANMLHQGSKFINDEHALSNYLAWLAAIENGQLGIPVPGLVIYLLVPTDARLKNIEHAKAEGQHDKGDLAERNVGHQLAVDQTARYLLMSQENWRGIICTNDDGTLRSIESIHEEIYDVVLKHLSSEHTI